MDRNRNLASNIDEISVKAYKQKTKEDLTIHPLAVQLRACDSPVAILTILQHQFDQFNQSRSGDERLRHMAECNY